MFLLLKRQPRVISPDKQASTLVQGSVPSQNNQASSMPPYHNTVENRVKTEHHKLR